MLQLLVQRISTFPSFFKLGWVFGCLEIDVAFMIPIRASNIGCGVIHHLPFALPGTHEHTQHRVAPIPRGY